MKSKYFLHSAEKESWYFEQYYSDLLEQPCKYKVVKEGWHEPTVWRIKKLDDKYKYISLHVYKKGEVIGIL